MILSSLALAVGGCDVVDFFTRPSSKEIANFCGVAVEDLERAKSEVKNVKSRATRDIGKCSVTSDGHGKVFVVSIQLPPKAASNG